MQVSKGAVGLIAIMGGSALLVALLVPRWPPHSSVPVSPAAHASTELVKDIGQSVSEVESPQQSTGFGHVTDSVGHDHRENAAGVVATISGRVIDLDGHPVKGVSVTGASTIIAGTGVLMSRSVSGVDGTFTLQGCLDPGPYLVEAELEGWWLQSVIRTEPGSNNVKLVLLRGGGLRGHVVAIRGTALEEYVVVVGDNPAKQEVLDNQGQVDMELVRLGYVEIRHPSGDVGTYLQPDGSFELLNVKPGIVSVTISMRANNRKIVTIADITIPEGAIAIESRLNPVDLDSCARLYDVSVVGEDGEPVPTARLAVFAGSAPDAEFYVEFEHGVARFVGPMTPYKFIISSEGYLPATLFLPTPSIRVQLDAE